MLPISEFMNKINEKPKRQIPELKALQHHHHSGSLVPCRNEKQAQGKEEAQVQPEIGYTRKEEM